MPGPGRLRAQFPHDLQRILDADAASDGMAEFAAKSGDGRRHSRGPANRVVGVGGDQDGIAAAGSGEQGVEFLLFPG